MKKKNTITAILLLVFMLATAAITYSIIGQLENNDDIFATDFDEDDF
jgi:hypothetical protein